MDNDQTPKNWKTELMALAKEFVFALITALLITHFVFTIPLVPSGSMIPTIEIDERVFVDKLSVRFSPIERGEIVVFPCPDKPQEAYIKRVIGLPGETLEIRDEKVYINGEELDEPYLTVRTMGIFGPYEIPDDSIFVMGDNRNASSDSRHWRSSHFVELKNVQGRGRAILWPLTKIRWLK